MFGYFQPMSRRPLKLQSSALFEWRLFNTIEAAPSQHRVHEIFISRHRKDSSLQGIIKYRPSEWNQIGNHDFCYKFVVLNYLMHEQFYWANDSAIIDIKKMDFIAASGRKLNWPCLIKKIIILTSCVIFPAKISWKFRYCECVPKPVFFRDLGDLSYWSKYYYPILNDNFWMFNKLNLSFKSSLFQSWMKLRTWEWWKFNFYDYVIIQRNKSDSNHMKFETNCQLITSSI